MDSLLTPPMMAGLMAAIAMFATVTSVMLPALRGDKLEARLKSVTEQRERLKRQSREALEQRGIRRESKGLANDITEKFNLKKALEDPNIEEKLLQAGYRGPGPIAVFYFARFALPFLFALGAFFYIFFVNDHGLQTVQKYGALLFAAAAGFYAPNIYVSNVGQKRLSSVMEAFPDSLDMMLICVESGMSVEMAFTKVGGEIGSASPELAEELQMTVAELSYLPERRMAYENLAKRCPNEGVKSVCMALIQGERYGTPLGDALRVMAKENRDLRMSEAEKKAASLPSKLTVPMILFFLPVLFIVILTPAAIKISENGGLPSS